MAGMTVRELQQKAVRRRRFMTEDGVMAELEHYFDERDIEIGMISYVGAPEGRVCDFTHLPQGGRVWDKNTFCNFEVVEMKDGVPLVYGWQKR